MNSRSRPVLDPGALLEQRRIVVCVGTGGVGKTTVAAALAAEGARRGRRTLVLTIDPARRLADALGVAEIGNEPVALSAESQRALGVPETGALEAVMLDMKSTFDDLVHRFADSPETIERILENPIYQHVSDALAGSSEYAAMEKVHELVECGRYDLVVVDTPPSQHALDFLDAPQRLLEFLDSRVVKVLLHPAFAAGRFGFKLFHRATRRVLQIFERVSGLSFLEDISEFLLAFEGMSEGFRERARRVRALLLGPESAFLLVAGPSPESAANALTFLDHLGASQVPLSGVVVNRMRLWPGAGDGRPPEVLVGAEALDAEHRALADALMQQGESSPDAALRAARAAVEAAAGYASLVDLDWRSTAPLAQRAERDGLFLRRVPEMARDVHDLEGLERIADHLFSGSEVAGGGARPASAKAVDDGSGTGAGAEAGAGAGAGGRETGT
ncbi:MAG: ArsA family ATPase [Myxococcota bacterium]